MTGTTVLGFLAAALTIPPATAADGVRWTEPTVLDGPNDLTFLDATSHDGQHAAALVRTPTGYDVLTSTEAADAPGWRAIATLPQTEIGTPEAIDIGNAAGTVAVAWCTQQADVPFSEIFLWTYVSGVEVTQKVADVSMCWAGVSIDGGVVTDGGLPTFTVAWGNRPAADSETLLTRTLWGDEWLDVETLWAEDPAVPAQLGSSQVDVAANGAGAVGFKVGYEVAGGLEYELRIATRGASRINAQHRWSNSFAANSGSRALDWSISMDPVDPTSVSATWVSDSGLLPSVQFVRRTLVFGALLTARQFLSGTSRQPEQVTLDSTRDRDILVWSERSITDSNFIVRSAALTADGGFATKTVMTGTAQGRNPDIDFYAATDNRMAIAVSAQATEGAGTHIEVFQDSYTGPDTLWTQATTTTLASPEADTYTQKMGLFIPANAPASLVWSTSTRAVDPRVTQLLAAKEVTPQAPGRPTDVTAEAGDASAVVRWRAPADTGTSPITGYLVTSTPDGLTCATAGAGTCTVQGLTNGTRYVFNVTALSDDGASPSSLPSNVVTPASAAAPSAPRDVVAVGGNTSATVTWRAPASQGASPISSYLVTSTPEDKTCTTAGALTCTVEGLTNGREYIFTVVASNATGAGLTSGFSNIAIPTAGRAPGSPTDVRASAGGSSATITWSAPNDPGTAPIVEYIVSSTPDGRICSTAGELTCTVDGLTNGERYTFAVIARSADGVSAPSAASNPVTPSSRPDAPARLTVKAKKKGTIVVRWTASTSPNVTGYMLGIRKGTGGWKNKDVGNVLTKTYKKVKAGTQACYRVAAVNDAGGKSVWTTKKCVVAKR